MHPIIKQQLAKVKKANLSNYNSETHEYFIPKHCDFVFDPNALYILELDDVLFTESVIYRLYTFNSGSKPPAKYVQASMCAEISGLVKLDCLAYDPVTQRVGTDMWTGWLPLDNIKVLKKM